MQENDLLPCRPLTADAGDDAAAALKADAVNSGAHIECQARQLGLLGIVWELIARGALTVKKEQP